MLANNAELKDAQGGGAYAARATSTSPQGAGCSTVVGQNVANLLWGYAKLNHKPDRLLRELTAKLTDAKFMDGLKPVEVADIAYALAVLGSQQEQGPLMHAMAGP